MFADSTSQIEHDLVEIREHFGYIPPFLNAVRTLPEVLKELWRQTQVFFLANPLPLTVKEKHFLYLSYIAEISYDLRYHCMVLKQRGVTTEELLSLLGMTVPTREVVEGYLRELQQQQLSGWPIHEKQQERQLFACSAYLFFNEDQQSKEQLRQVLGEQYTALSMLHAYIKNCHYWRREYPEAGEDERLSTQLQVFSEHEPLLTEILRHTSATLSVMEEQRERLPQMEARLRKSEERLQHLLDANIIGIVFAQEDGTITDANDRFLQMTSYTRDDLYQGMICWKDMTPTEYAVLDQQGIQEMHDTGNCTPFEKEYIRKDGSRVPVLVGGIVLDKDNNSWLCFVIDLTRSKQLERRTQQSLDALLGLAESLVVGPGENATRPLGGEYETPWTTGAVVRRLLTFTRSMVGCERISMLSVHPTTEEVQPIAIIGFSDEEERLWWNHVPGTQLAHHIPDTTLRDRLYAGESLILDKRKAPLNQLANNAYDGVTWLVAPMHLHNQLVGLISLDYGPQEHTYTTEEQRFAQAVARLIAIVLERDRLLLHKAEKQAREIALEEANQRMNEFLSIASHELKTPITSIKGNIQMLLRRQHRELQRDLISLEEHRQSAEEIALLLSRADDQINRLTRLVNDMVKVTRAQAKKLEMRIEKHDLLSSVRDVVLEQQQQAARRVIRLHTPPVAHIPVMMDVEHIEQVLINYLLNALKYSETEKPVDVFVRLYEDAVQVAVKDEGPGLSAIDREHIWERFYRAKTEIRSGSGIGFGLGLYICKAIIEEHGGQVGVESMPGQGATFWFTLKRMVEQ